MHAVPIAWRRPDELLALLPAGASPETPADEALSVVRDIAEVVAGPCRVGVATGPASRLSQRGTGPPAGRCVELISFPHGHLEGIPEVAVARRVIGPPGD